MKQDVEQFFDSIRADYDGAIDRCVPRYREMLWAIFAYLPRTWRPARILELGCGTGNLTEQILKRYPDARLTAVDFSEDMIAACRERVGAAAPIDYLQQDFRTTDFPAGSFDLILSSIALHHLTDPEKQELFPRLRRWLTADGIFTYSDQFAGATPELYEIHMSEWRSLAPSLGSTEEDWQTWMQHQQEHDHHASLPDQLDWLRAAGFTMVDCPWRYLLWTVVQARQG